MRLLLTIILTILLPPQIVLAQTRDEIIQFKIYRIDQEVFSRKGVHFYSRYFDAKGNLIKTVESYDKLASRAVSKYKYMDTLCIQNIDEYFEKNKLIDRVTEVFKYAFDKEKKIISKTSITSAHRISKEVYAYNSRNQFDTVFIYDNDTAIGTSAFNWVTKLKKESTLKKIKTFNYFDSNRVVIRECDHPFSSNPMACKTFESIESDTLDIYIERYWGVRGCMMDSAESVRILKRHKKDGLMYLFETTDFPDKVYYSYLRNSFGLVVEKRETDNSGEKMLMQ